MFLLTQTWTFNPFNPSFTDQTMSFLKMYNQPMIFFLFMTNQWILDSYQPANVFFKILFMINLWIFNLWSTHVFFIYDQPMIWNNTRISVLLSGKEWHVYKRKTWSLQKHQRIRQVKLYSFEKDGAQAWQAQILEWHKKPWNDMNKPWNGMNKVAERNEQGLE